MKKLLMGVMVGALFAGIALAAENTEEKQALQAAGEWLALVDGGKYGESWDEASTIFKGAITREQWKQALGNVRTPLGKLVKRTLLGAKYVTELPGAPKGQYVVIQFKTDYDNRKGVVETVTPMVDKDQKWRVSGYYVK